MTEDGVQPPDREKEQRYRVALEGAQHQYEQAPDGRQDEFRRLMAREAAEASKAGMSDQWIGERLCFGSGKVRRLIDALGSE